MTFVLRHLFVVGSLLIALSIQAQELKDTLLLEEVVILKKKQEYSVGSRITSIDSNYLKVNNSSTLGDALEMRSPVYIKSYGNGMSSTISFRGTGASHTAVLWNGFNIASPSLGLSDFSIIPLSGISSVNVLYGSASSNYGSGSIGGTILISSDPEWKKGLSVKVQQDVGSYAHYFSSASVRVGTYKFQSITQAYTNNALNDFKFRNTFKDRAPWEWQQNAVIHQYGITQDLDFRFSNKLSFSLKGWYNYSNRQIQIPLGVNNSHDRQKDQDIRVASVVNYQSSIGSTVLRVGYFNNKLDFRNDYIISNSLTQSVQSQLEHEVKFFKDNLRIKGGVELQRFRADIIDYGGIRYQNRASGFVLIYLHPIKRLNISYNMRKPYVQGYNPPLTPSLGINYNLLASPLSVTNLKFNLSKGYRVPTLNDLYWVPGGNPNLKPETSRNIEAGLLQKFYFKNLLWESEITFYRMLVDNWILWSPSNTTTYWSPSNIAQVKAEGVELSSKISYHKRKLKLSSGFIYSYTSSRSVKTSDYSFVPLNKQLIYVPLNKMVVYSDLYCGTWSANINFSFTGYRYTTSDNKSFLPGYGLLNVSVGKAFSINKVGMQIFVKVNNLLNQTYQSIESRVMPLSNYMLSVRINYNK